MGCAISGCKSFTRPGHLMCSRHWYVVPPATRRAVNREYEPGVPRQSGEYFRAVADAIKAVRRHEREAV